LNELDKRSPLEFNGGTVSFTGDGATTTFTFAHGLSTTPTVVLVGKQASGLPDIDCWTADATNISVVFKSAPASGVEVRLWWFALRW